MTPPLVEQDVFVFLMDYVAVVVLMHVNIHHCGPPSSVVLLMLEHLVLFYKSSVSFLSF